MSKAIAYIFGGVSYPKVTGVVHFNDTQEGDIRIDIDIKGLSRQIHHINIHTNGSCIDSEENAFISAGDALGLRSNLPPLLPGKKGCIKMTFYTNLYTVTDILGCTVIINENAADSQRIACGKIRRIIQGKNGYI